MKIIRHNNGMWARGDRHARHDFEIIASVCEGDEYRLRQLTKANLIVDVGGHIGSFSRLANRLFPKATIMCVEPFHESHELCVKNVGHCAIIENIAIGYDATTATIHRPVNDAGLSAGSVSCQNDEIFPKVACDAVGTVEMTTLSALLDKHNLNGPIDFMKLDCEGAELPIIERDEAILRTKRIAMEWHGQDVLDRITARLHGLGWAVEQTNHGHPVGGLFASNPHL